MIDAALLRARADMLALSDDAAAVAYVQDNGALPGVFPGAFGSYTVANITDCGSGRFDFAREGEGLPAFLLEAFDADGETPADVVGWVVDRPDRVLSMFARLAFLGESQAVNPASYFAGLPLDVHRTPLEWMQNGCRGVAVVVPHLAAMTLLHAPAVAGRDDIHTAQLATLARTAIPVFDATKFLSASQPRRAA